ncbi:MAG: sigma-70 family RNA polymerase sigma factor [Hyphomicrobiaceae bacterium]
MPARGTEGSRPGNDGAASPVPDDDAQLLGRIAAHDSSAFRILVDRHLPALLAAARRILGDHSEAEDAVQEAFLRLWQSGDGLEFGASGARPWLRRVVSNLCIDRIRAGRRTEVTDEIPELETLPDQLTGIEEGELAARVEAALNALPERQRQALVLFHYEGLSQIEVGAALGISDEAVESLLSRARRALRAMLRDEWRQLLPDMP